MFKKAVFIAVLLVALTVSAAFAYETDNMTTRLSGVAAGVGPQARVFVNPDGLGDVLLYGYYNVRNKEQFFTITNTDSNYGARVRIRFREAKTITNTATGQCNGSAELADFDICLSPNDVWTGHLATDVASGAAYLDSPDTDTAVVTTVGHEFDKKGASGTIGVDIFKNIVFDVPGSKGKLVFKFGSANSNAGITADMTREGYYEVIAEHRLIGNNSTGGNCTDKVNCCGILAGIRTSANSDVANVLMGHAYNIDLSNSSTMGYTATALGDFARSDIWGSIGGQTPNLKDSGDESLFPTINPVNYALTKSKVMTIYDVKSDVLGITNAVLTFPTKWATHTCPTGNDIFDDTNVMVQVFDDQENSPTTTCTVSPCPPGQGITIDNEVNLIGINGIYLFTSDVTLPLATQFSFGWASIDFTQKFDGTSPSPAHYTACSQSILGTICVQAPTAVPAGAGYHQSFGWPVIGFALHQFGGNGFVTGTLPLQASTNVVVIP